MIRRRNPTWTHTDSLARLASGDRFDVAVVGGGVIGAAAALDAAARGLSVVLVEQGDFASGTSSKSTKLLHGGIRYLPHFQFGLIREGLLEQRILARTADFLFDPLEFILPLYRGRGMADLPRWASSPRLLPFMMGLGLTGYDILGRRRGAQRHRKLSAGDVARLAPSLRTDGLRSGFLYHDAQTDDARLTITVLKTAVQRYGATAVAGIRVNSVNPDGGEYRLSATSVDDGGDVEIHARSVIAATWAFRPPSLTGSTPNTAPRLSKGVHLLYRADDLELGDQAIVFPETEDDRVMFVVPWHGMALVGTTDTPYDGTPSEATATDEDIAYLRRHVEQYLDVGQPEHISTFAGLRALADDDGSTARASRDHEMVRAAPGYTQVIGGKLTAYRPIAAEAVDTLMGHLGIDAQSPTATEALIGAGAGEHTTAALTGRAISLGFDDTYAQTLWRRYGADMASVLDIIEGEPDSAGELLPSELTIAEVRYAARQEAARAVADVTIRRTHVAWSTDDHARKIAPAIADELAVECGWTPEQLQAELDRHEDELQSQRL